MAENIPSTRSYTQLPPDSTGKKLLGYDYNLDGGTVQVPCTHISCSANPEHLMLVDARGQAYTRSAEGSPTIDAWGNARTAEQNMLSAYDFSVNGMDDLFTDFIEGNASVVHNVNRKSIVLTVDGLATSEAHRITNRYHYCLPGVGINCVFSIMAGDSGKTGNTRMFGYGDHRNGLFFALIDNTINIIVRSDATGTIVDEVIPQSEWNGDKLDGTGVSAFNLDPTKIQLMFIDFSWIGTGIARFGAYTQDGSRWVCHTHDNAGSSSFPYLTSGSLPISFENFNTSATTGTSEFFIYGATVYNSSVANFTFWRYVSDSGLPREITTNTPLISMKSKLQLDDSGDHNPIGLYPETLSLYITGGTCYLQIVDDGVLTDPVWEDDHASTSLIDRSATAIADGVPFLGRYLGPGTHEIDLRQFYELNDEGYCTLADGSDSYVMSVVASKIEGTTVNVACSLNYRELR